jgi:type IV secretory pathway VirB4 component
MGHNGIVYRIGTANNNPVYWKPNECHNPHLILAGATGSGKTYTIREILSAFMAQGVNFTVIDKHGDMDSLGDIVECRFGYGFNRGINPLTIHPDVEYGGPGGYRNCLRLPAQ